MIKITCPMGQLKSSRRRNSDGCCKSISEGLPKCNFGFFNGTTVETTTPLTTDGSLILYGMMKTEKKLLAFDFTRHGAGS
jgi:threonyl-tRNA synthetase